MDYSKAKAVASSGGARYFKPGDYTDATVIIIEPTGEFKYDVEDTYEGKVNVYEIVSFAELTIFVNEKELENGTPSVDGEVNQIQQKALAHFVKRLHESGESAIAVTVGKPKGKNYWAFAVADEATFTKAAEYLNARDEALGDAPFED